MVRHQGDGAHAASGVETGRQRQPAQDGAGGGIEHQQAVALAVGNAIVVTCRCDQYPCAAIGLPAPDRRRHVPRRERRVVDEIRPGFPEKVLGRRCARLTSIERHVQAIDQLRAAPACTGGDLFPGTFVVDVVE